MKKGLGTLLSTRQSVCVAVRVPESVRLVSDSQNATNNVDAMRREVKKTVGVVKSNKRKRGAIKALLQKYEAFLRRVDAFVTVLCWIIPVKQNRIVFQSSIDYWDNPRVFSDYLVRNRMDLIYNIVWVVDEPKKYYSAGNIKFVKRHTMVPSIYRDYMVATAKVIIYSHSNPAPNWCRRSYPNQTFILTTHSASQLKRSIDKTIRKKNDYILCCGQDAFLKRLEAWEMREAQLPLLGMPRLDLMYSHRDCLAVMFPQHTGKKLILAMETFKMSERYSDAPESNDCYGLNVITNKNELDRLDEFLEDHNAVLVIKTHHLQDMSFIEKANLSNVLFLTDEELRAKDVQLNEFLENASVLLTDYSSVFYDFLLVNRPIGFMVADMEQYTRGFITDDPFSEMPGQKIKDVDELIAFIIASLNGKDLYEGERQQMAKKVFAHFGPNNCKRLLRWLKQEMILPS